MIASNRPKIKSINEEYGEGDLVLIKYGDEYTVGKHNGVFIETIRENVVIPKSEIEIELDRKKTEEEERIKNLEITLATKSEKDKEIEIIKQNRARYFDRFKKRFNIPEDMTMEELFREESSASEMLDFYVSQMEGIEDEEEAEYIDSENEDGDGAY
jgi:hypothetical protein